MWRSALAAARRMLPDLRIRSESLQTIGFMEAERWSAVELLARHHGGEFGTVGTAALAHGVVDVGTDGCEADVEQPRDIPVGAASGDQRRDVAFPRRQRLIAVTAAHHRAPQKRLQRIQEVDLAALEILSRRRPPDPEVAEIAITVEDVHVDAVVQA